MKAHSKCEDAQVLMRVTKHWRITEEYQNPPSEESRSLPDPLGVNKRNPAKKQQKSVLKLNQMQY